MKKVFIAIMAAALVVCSCKPKTETVTETAPEAEETCCGDCSECDGCCSDIFVADDAENACNGDGTCADKKCCGDCKDQKGTGDCKDCNGDGTCADKKGCGDCKDQKGEGKCQGSCADKKCEGKCHEAAKSETGCVYCGACSCPMEINIAKINELYDKAVKAGKVTPEIKAAYDALPKHASDCVECGSCTEKCPKGIDIPAKMKAAAKLFGK